MRIADLVWSASAFLSVAKVLISRPVYFSLLPCFLRIPWFEGRTTEYTEVGDHENNRTERTTKARLTTSMLREANWKDKLLYRIGRRRIFKVAGNSMLPTLKDGDAVMIAEKSRIVPGDIVLAQHPYKKSVQMLKRVESIDDNGRYSLLGDNPDESTDSRTFGTVSIEYIHGKAVCRLANR